MYIEREMWFKREGTISSLSRKPVKLVDKYLGSSVLSTENEVDIRLAKAWNVNKIKLDFFQAVFVSILLYGCTPWMLTKHIDKNATSYFEQIQEATSHEPTAVRPLTSHLISHTCKTNKTCGTLVENQRQAHVMFFYGPFHMDWPVLADQQELIYINCVQTQHVVWKNCRERWMIGTDEEREREREREGGIFAVSATWWYIEK